jgi:hypothetical protein
MQSEQDAVRGAFAADVQARRMLPRRRLGRATVALLVLLRVYVTIAIPVVAYAFVHALMTTPR